MLQSPLLTSGDRAISVSCAQKNKKRIEGLIHDSNEAGVERQGCRGREAAVANCLTVHSEVGRLRTSLATYSFAKGPVEFVSFDAEYVRLLTERDSETERHFVAYFGELIRIKLRSKLKSPQLIEEVRQETFLRVINTLRRKGGLQHPERLGAFVNTVCNNVMMESIRGESRTNQYPDEGFDPVDARVDIESDLVTEERKKTVKTVLDGLPQKHRELLEMVFIQEKDKDEVCRQMNVDREYLRVLIHRAKDCFRTSYVKKMIAPTGEQ
jgi:RNA polymerase sigma-70 factor, ECF subfamily